MGLSAFSGLTEFDNFVGKMRYKMNIGRTIQILICAIVLSGCHGKSGIDISKTYKDIEIQRFEQDLFAIPADSIWQHVPQMEQKYGQFLDLFSIKIINIGGTNQLNYDRKLASFLTDPDICGSMREVNRIFGTGKLKFEKELSEAWARLAVLFPEKEQPKIYTHISGFNQNIVVDSGLISISLDKYLGTNNKYYQMLRTPVYLQHNMHPQKIASDVVTALGLTEFEYTPKDDNLISQMLYYGKIHVFLDYLLPDSPDSLKWGYSQSQMDWCEKNERLMWTSMVDKNALFSTSVKEINRMVNPGPFTASFSQKSPGGVGQWIGYKIIKSYLKHNPNVTLQDLMRENDYQLILNSSHYKP